MSARQVTGKLERKIPNVWEYKKASLAGGGKDTMAKYLGGINNPNIDVVDITEVEFLDFEMKYYDKKNPDDLKSLCIYDNLDHYEVITSEKIYSSGYSFTWGLAGYLAGGPLWGVIGAILGESSTRVKNRVVFCSLNNGWQFALELDEGELGKWQIYMGHE